MGVLTIEMTYHIRKQNIVSFYIASDFDYWFRQMWDIHFSPCVLVQLSSGRREIRLLN